MSSEPRYPYEWVAQQPPSGLCVELNRLAADAKMTSAANATLIEANNTLQAELATMTAQRDAMAEALALAMHDAAGHFSGPVYLKLSATLAEGGAE
jgi:hypothetical protein